LSAFVNVWCNSIELSRNRDELALAVQAASANQVASMLEQAMVDCGRA
jgi:hypothetical protein